MAKTLFIPPLGTELVLAQDWTFDLHYEYRNSALFVALKITRPENVNLWNLGSVKATLSAGTPLIVRRYYIRQGQNDFDSVTFSAKLDGKWRRFWVNLPDANRIVMEEVAHG